jgi:hypothetical protein
MEFREPDWENCRREAEQRLKVIKKFERSMEEAQKVSPQTWLKEFRI